MAWTSPRTWTTAEIVTAAFMNAHVRDNFLETAPSKAAAAGDMFYATGANALAKITNGITTAWTYGATSGLADTYAVTLTPAPAAYVEGMMVAVKININNTGASTINVNSLGAKSIKRGNGNNPAAGQLKTGSIYTLRYNGTNFILQGEGGSGNAVAADLLFGKTASTDISDITGTMPNNAGDNVNSSSSVAGTTLKLVAPLGYYDGSDDTVTITDADFVAGNIKNGVGILGLTGSYPKVNITAGDNVFYYRTGDTGSTNNSIYSKYRDVKVGLAGTYRIKFDLATASAGTTVYGRIYVNDSAVGTERSTTSASYTTYSEDITVSAGDNIQLYFKTSNMGVNCLFRNFLLCIDSGANLWTVIA